MVPAPTVTCSGPVLLVTGAETPIGLAVVIALGLAGERVVAVAEPRLAPALLRAGALAAYADVDSALASWEEHVERSAVCRAFDEPLAKEEVATLCARTSGGVVATSSSRVYEGRTLYLGSRAAKCARPLTENDATALAALEEVMASAAAAVDPAVDRSLVALRFFDVYGGDLACGLDGATDAEAWTMTTTTGGVAARIRALCTAGQVDATWARRYYGDVAHVDEAASWVCCALMRLDSMPRGFHALNAARGVLTRGRELVAAANEARALADLDAVTEVVDLVPAATTMMAAVPMRPDIQKMRSFLQLDPAATPVAAGIQETVLEKAARLDDDDDLDAGHPPRGDGGASSSSSSSSSSLSSSSSDGRSGDAAPLLPPPSIITAGGGWLRGAWERVSGRRRAICSSEEGEDDDDNALRLRLPALVLVHGVLSFCDAASLARLSVAVPKWGDARLAEDGLPERAAAGACADRMWGKADARGKSWAWLMGRDGTWRKPLAWCEAGPSSAHSSTVYRGQCYVFGGLDAAGEPTNALRLLRLDAGFAHGHRAEWVKPPPTTGTPPTPRFAHGAALVGGNNEALNKVDVKAGLSMIVDDDDGLLHQAHLVVFGGRTVDGDSNDVYVLQGLDGPALHWSSPRVGGPAPPPRSFATVAALEGRVIVWGGSSGGTRPVEDCAVWSLDTLSRAAPRWTRHEGDGRSTAPPPRYAHATVALFDGTSAVVCGGRDATSTTLPITDAHQLRLTPDGAVEWVTWAAQTPPPPSKTLEDDKSSTTEKEAALPAARSHHCAVTLDYAAPASPSSVAGGLLEAAAPPQPQGRRILCLGGLDAVSTTLDDAWILGPDGALPRRFDAAGTDMKRRAFTATLVDCTVVVLGGQDDTKRLDHLALLSLGC